ncbi:hypothetical protein ACFTSD_07780 [Nocardiaceae bacterium NPDC056970]
MSKVDVVKRIAVGGMLAAAAVVSVPGPASAVSALGPAVVDVQANPSGIHVELTNPNVNGLCNLMVFVDDASQAQVFPRNLTDLDWPAPGETKTYDISLPAGNYAVQSVCFAIGELASLPNPIKVSVKPAGLLGSLGISTGSFGS